MKRGKRAASKTKPKAAATKDILGAREKRERVAPRWQKHYQRLTELLGLVVSEQSNLSRDALEERPSFSSHQADAGTDSFDRDFCLSLLSFEQDAVYEIEQALERIRNGTYGICELTGKPIEAHRLEAIPWTRFSAAAEKELELQGSVNRARLGPRQSVERTAPPDESEEED